MISAASLLIVAFVCGLVASHLFIMHEWLKEPMRAGRKEPAGRRAIRHEFDERRRVNALRFWKASERPVSPPP